MNTAQTETLAELIERLRSLSIDHGPTGWPAVRTRDVTALLDRIAELEAVGAGGVSGPLMGRAALSANAGEPTEDVKQKIASNTWDNFGDILPTLKAISRGEWYWGANSRCKYIEIRLDTRDGGCLLYDRERVRISPEQLAHQHHRVRTEPWPASNSLAAPPTAPAGVTILFEHEDGRYAVNQDTAGDPAWHRLGPVDISAFATPAQSGLTDAYAGAREDLSIWKRRALEAESTVRSALADSVLEDAARLEGKP